jgi:nucleoside-diphosphate-sugar epimerase
VLVLLSDPSVAKERLGWTPSVSLEEGVARTVTWLRQHMAHYKAGFLHE